MKNSSNIFTGGPSSMRRGIGNLKLVAYLAAALTFNTSCDKTTIDPIDPIVVPTPEKSQYDLSQLEYEKLKTERNRTVPTQTLNLSNRQSSFETGYGGVAEFRYLAQNKIQEAVESGKFRKVHIYIKDVVDYSFFDMIKSNPNLNKLLTKGRIKLESRDLYNKTIAKSSEQNPNTNPFDQAIFKSLKDEYPTSFSQDKIKHGNRSFNSILGENGILSPGFFANLSDNPKLSGYGNTPLEIIFIGSGGTAPQKPTGIVNPQVIETVVQLAKQNPNDYYIYVEMNNITSTNDIENNTTTVGKAVKEGIKLPNLTINYSFPNKNETLNSPVEGRWLGANGSSFVVGRYVGDPIKGTISSEGYNGDESIITSFGADMYGPENEKISGNSFNNPQQAALNAAVVMVNPKIDATKLKSISGALTGPAVGNATGKFGINFVEFFAKGLNLAPMYITTGSQDGYSLGEGVFVGKDCKIINNNGVSKIDLADIQKIKNSGGKVTLKKIIPGTGNAVNVTVQIDDTKPLSIIQLTY